MHASQKTRVRLGAVALGAVTTLLVAGCTVGGGGGTGTGASLEDMEPVTLTFSDITPEASEAGQLLVNEIFPAITERTGGKITFDTYFSASLNLGEEQVAAVGSGLADMGTIVTTYFP